ncbi:hypothetical protein LWI28_004327 [Acer negundo]|uniref:Uncharacterized protein n=1 Tax=Acer negundo TaxID=4023 RepID=A0AAD5NM16_ACENE|nr:hypothetical protein LWI28_004327 [Acer negundo]
MEVELRNFVTVWFFVLLSLCYCYAFGNKISKGIKRLLFVLPIVVLFVYLPLDLYSFHLNSITSFTIGFLGNLKLLLFAFGEMTCFFLLHGMWVAVEIELKKMFKKWHFPWLISVFLTLGFLLVTLSWLFFSPLKRCKAYVSALDEYVALAALFYVGL